MISTNELYEISVTLLFGLLFDDCKNRTNLNKIYKTYFQLFNCIILTHDEIYVYKCISYIYLFDSILLLLVLSLSSV